MQINTVATHYTVVPPGTTTIIDNGAIIIHGIFCQSSGISNIALKESDNTTSIFTIRLGPATTQTSIEIRTPFLAKNGLVVTTSITTPSCTVFYSSLGS